MFCQACIMPLDTSEERERGSCQRCAEGTSSVDASSLLGEEAFLETLAGFAGRGDKGYDILLPISGGKDSSFIMFYVMEVCRAERVLAYSFDNGWFRDEAIRNMERGTRAYGLTWERDAFLTREDWARIGAATLRAGCDPCTLCFPFRVAGMLNRSMEYQLPAAVLGFEPGQLESPQIGTGVSDEQQRRNIASFAKGFLGFISAIEPAIPDVVEKMDTFLANLRRLANDEIELETTMRDVLLARYLDWTGRPSAELARTLNRAFGYVQASPTVVHTNCRLEQLRGYGLMRGRSRAFYVQVSPYVRRGLITREEGFSQIELLGQTDPAPEVVDEFCELGGISRPEFDRLLPSCRR